MHPWVEAAATALVPLANVENTGAMKSYMRDQFDFFGIQAGPRREATKTLLSKAELPLTEEVPVVVDELWSLPQREYQMVALDLLIKHKQRLPVAILADVERWITTKSWWDTVDMLATHIVGALCLRYPAESLCYIERWRHSDNIWLRRTALLYQLKYRHKTDKPLLFSIIRDNQQDKEFFIQKAIGWALRELSKSDANAVTDFIRTQNIDGLAKREGLKWLKTRGRVSDSREMRDER